MNPLHTQGDWVCIDGNIFSDGFTTETPIARVFKRKSPHVTLANARLIAASPELLEALKNYHLPIDLDNLDLSRAEFGPESVRAELQRRAAIAKATREAL